MKHNANLIGRKVAKLRYRRNWSQETLVAMLQTHGCKITRAVIANVETKRSVATDKEVLILAETLGVSIAELFLP